MNVIKHGFVGLFLIVGMSVFAQHFQYSQYNFSTQRVNPAWVSLTRNALVDFSYRNQKTGGDFQLNTNFLSVAYPFITRSTGKPWGGLGLSLLSDKSGLLFKSQEAAVTYAVNIPTGKNQMLSLGFKGLMRWQRINLDGLFTGSQYLEGHGFSPALDNGEVPHPFQSNFFTLSSGLLWQQTNRNGKLLKQIGFSFFDFNKPNPTFLDGTQDELPSTLVMHGAWRIYQNKLLGVIPEFLITRSATRNVLISGTRFEYAMESPSDRVDILIKYAVGRSGIVGIQFHRQNFSLGLSYDFPVGNGNVGNLGAMEVGLELRAPVDPKSKRRIVQNKNGKPVAKNRKRNQVPARKSVGFQKPTPPHVSGIQSTAPLKIDSVIQSEPVNRAVEILVIDTTRLESAYPKAEVAVGNIKHEPLMIESVTLHFRFDYNSTDLDDETELFLKELSHTLLANPDLSVQITGHTDNVGAMHMNQRLSLKRADAARNYLIKLGVENSRIVADGKGMTEPLNGNRTDEERERNRRVEVKLFRNP